METIWYYCSSFLGEYSPILGLLLLKFNFCNLSSSVYFIIQHSAYKIAQWIQVRKICWTFMRLTQYLSIFVSKDHFSKNWWSLLLWNLNLQHKYNFKFHKIESNGHLFFWRNVKKIIWDENGQTSYNTVNHKLIFVC